MNNKYALRSRYIYHIASYSKICLWRHDNSTYKIKTTVEEFSVKSTWHATFKPLCFFWWDATSLCLDIQVYFCTEILARYTTAVFGWRFRTCYASNGSFQVRARFWQIYPEQWTSKKKVFPKCSSHLRRFLPSKYQEGCRAEQLMSNHEQEEKKSP